MPNPNEGGQQEAGSKLARGEQFNEALRRLGEKLEALCQRDSQEAGRHDEELATAHKLAQALTGDLQATEAAPLLSECGFDAPIPTLQAKLEAARELLNQAEGLHLGAQETVKVLRDKSGRSSPVAGLLEAMDREKSNLVPLAHELLVGEAEAYEPYSREFLRDSDDPTLAKLNQKITAFLERIEREVNLQLLNEGDAETLKKFFGSDYFRTDGIPDEGVSDARLPFDAGKAGGLSFSIKNTSVPAWKVALRAFVKKAGTGSYRGSDEEKDFRDASIDLGNKASRMHHVLVQMKHTLETIATYQDNITRTELAAVHFERRLRELKDNNIETGARQVDKLTEKLAAAKAMLAQMGERRATLTRVCETAFQQVRQNSDARRKLDELPATMSKATELLENVPHLIKAKLQQVGVLLERNLNLALERGAPLTITNETRTAVDRCIGHWTGKSAETESTLELAEYLLNELMKKLETEVSAANQAEFPEHDKLQHIFEAASAIDRFMAETWEDIIVDEKITEWMQTQSAIELDELLKPLQDHAEGLELLAAKRETEKAERAARELAALRGLAGATGEALGRLAELAAAARSAGEPEPQEAEGEGTSGLEADADAVIAAAKRYEAAAALAEAGPTQVATEQAPPAAVAVEPEAEPAELMQPEKPVVARRKRRGDGGHHDDEE